MHSYTIFSKRFMTAPVPRASWSLKDRPPWCRGLQDGGVGEVDDYLAGLDEPARTVGPRSTAVPLVSR
jgi:hypothetical protein